MARETIAIEGVFTRFVSLLNKLKLPYMIVGGFAVNYYGRSRNTDDIDAVVALGKGGREKLFKELDKNDYKYHRQEIAMLAELSNRFAIADPGDFFRIDIWIPKTSHELRALERRKKKKYGDMSMYLISPEDLIIFKLVASRPHDLTDALWVLKRQKGKLDRRYLKLWADALLVGDRLKKLER